jgi:cytochrome c oxidase subunit IV
MSDEKPHITSYKTLALTLLALLVITAASVGITRIELGPLNTAAALILASIKALIVLVVFMHLKFETPLFSWLTAAVFVLIVLVIIVTFFDYSFR